jgi:hypothetical protein
MKLRKQGTIVENQECLAAGVLVLFRIYKNITRVKTGVRDRSKKCKAKGEMI